MTATALERFVDELRELGLHPRVEAELVIYEVEPIEGAHAGKAVPTGVEVAELQRWPLVPPHWVHLPGTVAFQRTNSQASPRSGWTKHSRQIAGWGRDRGVAAGWIAHIRAILGEATA